MPELHIFFPSSDMHLDSFERLRIPNQVIDGKTRSHHKACHHSTGSFMMLMTWDNDTMPVCVCGSKCKPQRTTEFDPGSLREMPYREAMNCLWMGPTEDGKYHRVDSWYNS